MEAPPIHRPPSPKLRLMCSYGGHIVPRPHDKSLFYAGGETRIVSVDRRSTASSVAALSGHLSRLLLDGRPFLLKYHLPSDDLDSLISVLTDEDLHNMLDEHDRVPPPARIRFFFFPTRPDPLGPKSDAWFSDALKSAGIGSDFVDEVKVGGAESVVLETSSSFGSTGSSLSVTNPPPIGSDYKVPSIESEISVGCLAAALPKTRILQEPLIPVVCPDESPAIPVFPDPSFTITPPKPVQVLGYPLPQLPDAKIQQPEPQLIQGGVQYAPPYSGPVPIPPYYPVYQTPTNPPQTQPYPVYLVPTRPNPYPGVSIPSNVPTRPNPYPSVSIPYNPFDVCPNRPPLPPQTASVIPQPVVAGRKEVFGSQLAEPPAKVYCTIPAVTQLVSLPSKTQLVGLPLKQGQFVMGPAERQVEIDLEPITTTTTSAVSSIRASEFDEDIAYNQIYKTQPIR